MNFPLTLFAIKRRRELTEIFDKIDTEIMITCLGSRSADFFSFKNMCIGKTLYNKGVECTILNVYIQANDTDFECNPTTIDYDDDNNKDEYKIIFECIPTTTADNNDTAFDLDYYELNESQKITLLDIIYNHEL